MNNSSNKPQSVQRHLAVVLINTNINVLQGVRYVPSSHNQNTKKKSKINFSFKITKTFHKPRRLNREVKV